jgi:hypothetical protein
MLPATPEKLRLAQLEQRLANLECRPWLGVDVAPLRQQLLEEIKQLRASLGQRRMSARS